MEVRQAVFQNPREVTTGWVKGDMMTEEGGGLIKEILAIFEKSTSEQPAIPKLRQSTKP